MLVMHLMGFSDRSKVDVVRSLEPRKSLMDEDIVYEEVSQTIDRNSQSDEGPPIIAGHHSEHDKQPTRNGEDQKEHIILFE